MLKMTVLALSLSLSLAAQAETTMHAKCSSHIQSRDKSDTDTTLTPVSGLVAGKTAKLGKIGGKDFSLALLPESRDAYELIPVKVQMTAKDGLSEVTSESSPDQDGVAWIKTVVKSSVTGESVGVECTVEIKY
jgi:hypothetical protein